MTEGKQMHSDNEWKFDELKQLYLQVKTGTISFVNWKWKHVKKNIVILILFAIAIASWQYFYYKHQQALYVSKAAFVYKELHKKTYGEMVDQLTTWIQEGNNTAVATALSILPEQAQNIKAIEALNMHGSKLSEDITSEKSPFYIVVKVANKKGFDSLAYKIEPYLNSNPLYITQKNVRKYTLTSEIKTLQHEYQLLDDVKHALLNNQLQIAASKNDALPIAELFQQSIEISKAITEKQAALQSEKAVEILHNFNWSAQPQKKSIMAVTKKGIAIYIIVSLIILLLSSIFRNHDTGQKA